MMQIGGCGSSNPSRQRYGKRLRLRDKDVPRCNWSVSLFDWRMRKITCGAKEMFWQMTVTAANKWVSVKWWYKWVTSVSNKSWYVCTWCWVLVLGWRRNSDDTSSNLSGPLIGGDVVQIYHPADVWAFYYYYFFLPFMAGCRCWETQVYNCDNDGEQLVRESFPATSTHLNFDLGINLSDTVRRGQPG